MVLELADMAMLAKTLLLPIRMSIVTTIALALMMVTFVLGMAMVVLDAMWFGVPTKVTTMAVRCF